ncbi:MAG TPA: hypothetical protein VN213_21725 [Solirubrobacteraceae bacterium]|nr:hypothetical protein [Solirubrobacteraceae bacterium]
MHRRAVAVAAVAILVPAAFAGAASAQEDSVRIRMTEFAFRMPDNLDAGRTRITFRNAGEFQHNFTVVSALGGGRAFRSATIEGGRTQSKTVSLRPGAYVAVCTVFNGGHLAQGMHTTFTVGEFDQESGEWGP